MQIALIVGLAFAAWVAYMQGVHPIHKGRIQ